MTNERAVEILNLDLDILGQYGGETAEAYKMAIKALEAQPQPIVMTKEEFERYLANEDLVVVKRKLLNEALESQLMRDATEEERKSVKDYIESISKPTGLQFEAQPCEDCISRQAVIILIDEASEMHPYKVVGDSDTYSNYNQGWSDACDWLYANIEGVPSVIPQIQPNSNEFFNFDAPMVKNSEAVSRKLAIEHIKGCCEDDGLYCVDDGEIIINIIKALPSVTPKYTDEEIDKIQEIEQAYVDKMVELAVEESREKWLNSFDTSSATKCFEAVNLLKQRLEEEE